MRVLKSVVVSMVLMSLGCISDIRRFPLKAPLWEDPDRNHVPERPSNYYSGLLADGADKLIFYPLADLFALRTETSAWNVNSFDEVPNSSWFTNRIRFQTLSPEQVRRGPCTGETLSPAHAPWTVVAAKPNGANPGFFIKAGDGRRYLLKFDGPQQPPRPTAADVIGSKLYWAAGYFVPCNEVVFFPPDIIKIDPEATSENEYGEDVPITDADVQAVLGKAYRSKNGLLRASASEFVNGRPLGPFRYEETRSDDPNDVIPHQHRRELRGGRLLAAWMNHHDTREQNSLDVWSHEGGRDFLKHYYIDFGDCFGGRFDNDMASRRQGYSYYLDWFHVGVDFLSLGIYPRPWYERTINEEAEIFGYYGHEQFVPSEWRGGYLNPAFAEMDHADALWMTRILSRFTKAHVQAAVEAGQLPDKRSEAYLIDLLMKRRANILREYTTQFSPLHQFQLVRRTPGDATQSLCFQDIAVNESLVEWKEVLYKLRFMVGEDLDEELGWLQFTLDPEHPGRSCVTMPLGYRRPHDLKPDAAPDDPSRYGVLKIFVHQKPSVRPTSVTELHFYDHGPEKGFQMVGIVRPPNAEIPGIY